MHKIINATLEDNIMNMLGLHSALCARYVPRLSWSRLIAHYIYTLQLMNILLIVYKWMHLGNNLNSLLFALRYSLIFEICFLNMSFVTKSTIVLSNMLN